MSQFPGSPMGGFGGSYGGGMPPMRMPRSPNKGGTRPMPQMPGGGRPMPGGPGKGGRGRISRGGGKGGRRPQGPMPMPMPQNPLGMGGGMGQPMPQNPLGENPRIGGGSLGGSYSPRGGGLQPVPPPMPPMGGGLQSMQYPHAIPPMSGGMSGGYPRETSTPDMQNLMQGFNQITADGPVPGAPYMQNAMKERLGDNMRSGSFSGGMFGGGGGSRFDAGGQPMGGGFGMQYGMTGQPLGMGPDVRTFGGGMGGMMGPPGQFMKRMPRAMSRFGNTGFSGF